MADLKLNRIPLANIAMKCARLARLTGDEDAQRWFQSEMAGYDPNYDPESFWIGWKAGRGVNETTAKPDSEKKIWTGSISSIEATIETLREEPSHLDVPPMTEGSSRKRVLHPRSPSQLIVRAGEIATRCAALRGEQGRPCNCAYSVLAEDPRPVDGSTGL